MPSYSVDRIKGLPPKKDGSKSMWTKENEIPRLTKLRKKVLAKRGNGNLLVKNISIVLRVHVGPRSNANVGDLDNFVTGVCDGLQKAHGNTNLPPAWDRPDRESIHPSKVIAIENDKEVISIVAEKIFDDKDPKPWYSIKLTGE
jgi:hypothetical protein